MSILLNPPATTVATLQAGDPTYDAILNIAKILKRSDKILQLKDIENAPLQRVKNNKSIINDTPLPRVLTSKAKDIHIIPFDQDEAPHQNKIDTPQVTI